MEKLNALTDLWFKVCVTVAIVLLAVASLFLLGVTNEMVVVVALAWLALVAVWRKHGDGVENPKNTGESGR